MEQDDVNKIVWKEIEPPMESRTARPPSNIDNFIERF
jgi:hypothetical protein